MSRISWQMLALGLLAITNGCAMCMSPYDYCHAMFQAQGDPCYVVERAGSILAPMADTTYRETVVSETPLNQAPATSANGPSNESTSAPPNERPAPADEEIQAPPLEPQPDTGANLGQPPRAVQQVSLTSSLLRR